MKNKPSLFQKISLSYLVWTCICAYFLPAISHPAYALDTNNFAVNIKPISYQSFLNEGQEKENKITYEKNILIDEPTNTVYERPYSLYDEEIDSKVLKRNTIVLVGAGVATMGLLYLMPSSFTNWEDDGQSPFSKWWDNVSSGPVMDKDDLFLNYITHPYSGAIYYMGARSAGADAFNSFLYSFALSTFFWEYGIESFAEVPSIQDLIITPIAGAILGEGFYLSKRHIIENDYKLLDSKALGKAAILLMDPITEVTDWIWGSSVNTSNFSMQSNPTVSRTGHLGYGLSINYAF